MDANEIEISTPNQVLELLHLFQLSDSSFPTGSFSHSGGFESAVQHGFVQSSKDDLRSLIITYLENTGSFNLVFVTEAYKKSKSLEDIILLDNFLNVSLMNHVANRASTKQGKSMLDMAVKVYQNDDLCLMLQNLQHFHYPIIFGVIFHLIGIDLIKTQTAYMSSVLRTITSSAVRLDKIGPMEAQRIQLDLQYIILDIINRNKNMMVSDASMKFPVIDILQNCHDTLFSKLFYS